MDIGDFTHEFWPLRDIKKMIERAKINDLDPQSHYGQKVLLFFHSLTLSPSLAIFHSSHTLFHNL